jgi:hypothetical protein
VGVWGGVVVSRSGLTGRDCVMGLETCTDSHCLVVACDVVVCQELLHGEMAVTSGVLHEGTKMTFRYLVIQKHI